MSNIEAQALKRIGGISANRLIIPIIVILAILHAGIIFLIFSINTTSSHMSQTMQNASVYNQDASSLLGGSSLLSKTANTFVLIPVTKGGDLNIGPLSAYATELAEDSHRGDQVAARFNTYQISKKDKALINEAADAANKMLEAQLHAIALVNEVHPLPDIPALASITKALPSLTAKELNYSDEQKKAVARSLILSTEYSLNEQTVSADINACMGSIRKSSGMTAAATARKIHTLRLSLWIVTISIILMLTATFLTLYLQLLAPMKKGTWKIRLDQPLDEKKGLYEMRELALAYNTLMHRRDTLDGILRAAAETDPLTNLPNRYAFQQYLVESGDEGYSLGVLLFDVNYLKKTNDTLGHSAGDELLKKSADCIVSCFGIDDESNCFRLGGDEFAAILKNPTSDLIEKEINLFRMEQQRRNLSISWGCALAEELGISNVNDLMQEADRRMYEQKQAMHRADQ